MEPTVEEKKILLETARQSIRSIFNGQKTVEPDYTAHPLFNTKSGAFVTLTISGSLRGCIGYIISDQPLFKTICETAVLAAQNDPRFTPLTEHEFKKTEIEISILSEPFPLENYEEIEVGRHGLILEEGGKRGLLLPQVPIEHHMNRDQYLDALCAKTGFMPGFWRQKQLKLKAFTATVFSEKELMTEVK